MAAALLLLVPAAPTLPIVVGVWATVACEHPSAAVMTAALERTRAIRLIREAGSPMLSVPV